LILIGISSPLISWEKKYLPMLMNFTQKHNVELQLANLTPKQFLNIAVETSRSLGWICGSVNEKGFVAYTNNGIFAWNAEVRLQIKNESANLVSQSRGNQVVEFGKDEENLQRFISTFNNLRKKATEKPFTSGYENLKLNFA
jgi:hypothetical protein